MDVAELITFLGDLKELRHIVRAETASTISKVKVRSAAEQLGSRWSSLLNDITTRGIILPDVLEKYSRACTRLVKISAPNNLKTSYLDTLDILTKRLRDELIIPLQTATTAASASLFDSFIASIADPAESDYFKESLDCARGGHLRAATVMAWCAAIDRIHRAIEQIGFDKFNAMSAQMTAQQKGRYKKFSTTVNVSSLSEMREVFDTTVLWIIEGMGLIDSNQHTRLRSCFEMRCHSAHPGEAPITEFNLISLFSDLQKIVMENPKFAAAPIAVTNSALAA
jgi:hypothetical protein